MRNVLVNSPNADKINTIEFALTKRMSRRWMAQGSFWVVKNNNWIEQTFETPNNDYFPKDETVDWAGNLSGSYLLPGDVRIAGFVTRRLSMPVLVARVPSSSTSCPRDRLPTSVPIRTRIPIGHSSRISTAFASWAEPLSVCMTTSPHWRSRSRCGEPCNCGGSSPGIAMRMGVVMGTS